MPSRSITACTNSENPLPMKNNIRVLRASRRMTQEELARLAGVSRQTVNAMESSRYVPSTILALKVAHIFGMTVDEVFTLEEGD